MSAPISYCHSPFLYHHVPCSPFLLTTKFQAQSPVPAVPDVDNQKEVKLLKSPYPAYRSNIPSPIPQVPGTSDLSKPMSQQATPTVKDTLSTPTKEQVVPNLSPLLKNSSTRKERRLDVTPTRSTLREIDLFSGDEIFA